MKIKATEKNESSQYILLAIYPISWLHFHHLYSTIDFFFLVISNDTIGQVKNGKLGDLAPTVLHRMGIAIPNEMTGNVLIS